MSDDGELSERKKIPTGYPDVQTADQLPQQTAHRPRKQSHHQE